MRKRKKNSEPPTLTSLILDLIDETIEGGTTLNALAKASGVSQPILYRFFYADHMTMTMRNADKLCAHFGIRHTTPRKSRMKAARDTEASASQPRQQKQKNSAVDRGARCKSP
jgi:hypothetical protein